MISKYTFLLFLILALALGSCSSKKFITNSFNQQQKINVGGGSEDFLLDTIEGNRLLISCDDRRDKVTQGSIWAHNLNSETAQLLPFENGLTFNFHPHGICLFASAEKTYLFVINHVSKDKSEIDRFIVTPKQLILDHRFTNIVGTPNDIIAIAADEFYYSDFKTFGASIVHYKGEYKKIVKHLKMPNGIFIENSTLYFSTTLNGKMYKVDLLSNQKRKLTKVKGGDNIMEHSSDELMVTSHPSFIKFARHAMDESQKSPSLVYLVNKINGNKKVFFYNDGTAISATSTALYFNGKLYLSQVFDPFILIVE